MICTSNNKSPDGCSPADDHNPGRVLVGMSGGVDSAVAAMTLLDRGYQVTAVRMRIYQGPGHPALISGCYGRNDEEDTASAAAMAQRLGLDFKVVDCSQAYQEKVMDYFRAEYLAGRTPNPCIRCNETIKFGALWELAAQSLDFDFFATGHYARIENTPDGPHLKRGLNTQKDQSYFLYRLRPQQLSRIIFPLGSMTKQEVRQLAAERGLAAHNRPDSQDFYGGDYVDLLNMPDRPGNIVDTQGRVLGRHQGFWHYTPGQRRGLGVAAPVPLYVLSVKASTNEVVVGPAEENLFYGCYISSLNFLEPEPLPDTAMKAKMRSAQSLKEVVVQGRDERGRLRVDFVNPLSGLAPGQSLVLYDQDTVVGGGIIEGD